MKFFASVCIFTTAIAAATSSSSPFLVHAHSNGDNAAGAAGSSSRMQRMVRRNVIDLSSHSATKQGHAHAHARRNATLLEVRQDKVASTVSNGTDTTSSEEGTRPPATLGDVVDKQGLGEFAKGSPYNVASAIQLIKEGTKSFSISSDSAKDDDSDMSSTGFVRRQESNEQNEDDNNDDEEECDADDDDDEDCDADADEECEEDDDEDDDDDDDDEECEEDGDDDDGDTSTGGNNAAIGAAVNLTTTREGDSSNLASGSLTAEKGCTKFATAKSGDSCYGLLGAEDDDALKAFYEANPSVDSDCQNLEIGVTYCLASS